MRKCSPRILLLLLMICLAVMLFLMSCGLNADTLMQRQQREMLSLDVTSKDFYVELMRTTNEKHRKETHDLHDKIKALEKQLEEACVKLNQTKFNNKSEKSPQPQQNVASKENKAVFYENFFSQKLKDSEVTAGIQLHNEYEIIAFNRFTLNRIYMVEPGMGKRVMEKPIGFKKRDLMEVISYGLEKLNQAVQPGDTKYRLDDFVEGIYRTEPSIATHYELYFRDINGESDSQLHKITLSRPFGPLFIMNNENVDTKEEIINIILPLSGRTDKFQGFMDRFIKVCIHGDKHVFLTVVYFGTEGLAEVKKIMDDTSRTYKFRSMKLVTLNEGFSRGRGLQVGAQSWESSGDVLMFLCDVDIIFNSDFLERCRLNTAQGRQVYYPMVFSLYNPNVVYALHNLDIPNEEDQLMISKDTGFWRDFGFGMTCQYRSDFLNLKGFDEQIVGWGMEDVLLYRKYVRSDLMVVRATDPGIFHLWHEKHCDPNTPWDQYRGCIRSKALNEASHAQLGMLAFKEEIDARKNLFKQQAKER